MKLLRCALLLCAAACTTQPRPPEPVPPVAPSPTQPASNGAPRSTAELAAAIDAAASRSDTESDSKIRAALAAQALEDAQTCLSQDPQAAACLYGRAVARGLDARAHPTRAGEILSSMLADLSLAESKDPAYDEAGPARVRSLVLIRAPGWPLGPGDVEAGLEAARRAVALRPRYPPNLLALAEALSKNGNAAAARDSYTQARDAAQAMPAGTDRDRWLREADEGLKRK